MKTTRLFSVVIALVLALSITTVAKTTVELKDAQGKSVGTALLWSKSGKGASSGVFIKASLHDLPPGVHAFHFHQKAQCDAPPAAGPSTTEICGTRPEARVIAANTVPTACRLATPSASRAPPECHRPTIGTPREVASA